MGFVPCPEHLKKGMMGAEANSLHPGSGLWAPPTQEASFSGSYQGPLYGPMVAPRPSYVAYMGLNPSSSTSQL